jgi:hypothetical protein
MCPQWSLESPPLSLGMFNSTLLNCGFDSKIFDINLKTAKVCNVEEQQELWSATGHFLWTNTHSFNERIVPRFNKDWENFIEEISEYDIATFTTYFSNITVTDYISKKIFDINPNIHIFYGGPYCWSSRGDALYHRPWVKVLCDREGDNIIKELVMSYNLGNGYEKVKGIYIFDDQNQIKFTGDKYDVVDINNISIPDWGDLDLNEYAPFTYNKNPHIPLQGSRGCIAKCTFCAETRIYRYKTADILVKEIIELEKKYKINNFSFVDSLINGSMVQFKKLIETLSNLIENGTIKSLNMGGYARTHKDMDDKLMKKAAKAGFTWFSIGVESGTPKILEIIEKRQTREGIEQLWEACWRNGIRMDANWITGYPKENTIDWLVSLYFLYKNKKFIQNVPAGQYPAGMHMGAPLDAYRSVFNISDNMYIFNKMDGWVTNNLKSNFINRFYRLKLTHLFLKTWKIFFSGFRDVGKSIKYINFHDKKSVFNLDEFKDWKTGYNGTFWTNHDNFKKHKIFYKVKDENYNVPYLEFANIPEDDEYDSSVNIVDTIKMTVRNEIRSWCWLIYQLSGPFDIEVEFDENYSELNIDGARLVSNFKFISTLDGNYNLFIKTKLKVDDTARQTIYIQNGGEEYENFDISFEDNFKDSGNMNDRYDNENYFQKKYGIPNYIDTMNTEKYKLNLKRTKLTGKY